MTELRDRIARVLCWDDSPCYACQQKAAEIMPLVEQACWEKAAYELRSAAGELLADPYERRDFFDRAGTMDGGAR